MKGESSGEGGPFPSIPDAIFCIYFPTEQRLILHRTFLQLLRPITMHLVLAISASAVDGLFFLLSQAVALLLLQLGFSLHSVIENKCSDKQPQRWLKETL